MTKEEAIKLIDDRMCFGRGKWSEHHKPEIDIYWQAGEMAIKALEAEPHWIPVDLENNEPPLEEWVLVSSDGYVMQDCIVERGGKKIWYHGGNIRAEDRYKPLPEPYKGVTE